MVYDSINIQYMKISITKNILPIYVSQIGLLFNLYGSAMRNTLINSLGVWIIVLSVILSIYDGIDNLRNIYKEIIIVIALIIISVMSMLASGWISYLGFVRLFSFLEIPIYIIFTKKYNTNKRIMVSCISAVISTILYIILYNSSKAYIFLTEYGERTIPDLTLGFSNPNETGMHLIATLFVLNACVFVYNKSKIQSGLLILCSLVNIYFIILTLSRATKIIVVIYLISLMITIIKKQIPKWFKILCFYSPIIVLIISDIFASFFSTHTLFGEIIDSGRINIYINRIRSLSFAQLIIGNYDYLFQNSLNAYVSVIVTIGIPALLLYLQILYQSIKRCENDAKNIYNFVAFLGILLFFVHGSLESANLVSGSFYAASFYSIYIVAIDSRI